MPEVMNVEKNGRLIVVLGMHRSGTSTITKSLELLGVGLGTDVHPAGSDNPKGFWEDRNCLEINNSLLKHLGSAYDRLSMGWDEIALDPVVSELRSRAISLITQRLNENEGIWGFKDPRTCRLHGFWRDVFLALNCEVSYVIAIRNPASVAASLASRNGIPAEKAYFLWLQHVLPAMRFLTNARSVVVDYDEFLASPYSQLVRISENLDLPLPDQQNSLVRNFENNFIENGLRHTYVTEAELALDERASIIVAETYSLLLRLAKDQEILESPGTQATLVKLNRSLRAASPAFEYINTLEDERLYLRSSLKRATASIPQSSPCAFSTGQVERLEAASLQPDKMLNELVLSLARAGHHKAAANVQGKLAALIQEGCRTVIINPDGAADWRYKIDLYQDGYIRGWVLDKNRPLVKWSVEISQGQRVIGRGMADQFRRDLAEAEIGDGCCAFKFKADVSPMLDGGAVVLRVVELDKVFEVQPASIRGVASGV